MAETLSIDFDSYAQLPAISRSALEDFIESPALYHGRHITRIFPQKDSAELRIGRALHSVVLEGATVLVDNFACPVEYRDTPPELVVQIPPDALTSNGHRRGKAWQAFASEHAGSLLLTAAEYADWQRWRETMDRCPDAIFLAERECWLVSQMASAVERHGAAMAALDGQREVSVVWDCEETGFRRKVRIDAVRALITDLKSSQNAKPQAFASSVEKYGYHRQAAWYTDAWQAVTGEELDFVFVVVQKSEPFTVACYTLTPRWIERGREEVASAFRRLAEIDWTELEYPTVLELDEPRWAAYQQEWSTT